MGITRYKLHLHTTNKKRFSAIESKELSMTTRLKKMVFLPITLLFLSACMEETRLPIAVGDSAPDTPGKWAVGHRNFVMIDANRNDRPLNVDV